MGGFFRFMQGLVVGASVGAGVGLIVAPFAGEELRELIKDRLAYILAEGRLAMDAKRREMEEEFAVTRRAEWMEQHRP